MADTKKKVAILSNITVDLIIGKLSKKYDFYQPEGFDAWVQDVINPASGLYKECVDAVVVLLDGTEVRGWKNVEEDQNNGYWEKGMTSIPLVAYQLNDQTTHRMVRKHFGYKD